MATGRIGTTPVLTTRWSKAPAGGTTSLSGLDDNSVSLVYSVGYEAVYRNGVLLSRGNDYTATDGTTITLIDATIAGDIIEVFANQLVPLSDAISKGQFTAKGSLLSATAASTPAVLAVGSNDQVLTADSSTATGLKWATPSGGAIKQIVTFTSTTNTTTTGGPVDTALTANITPSSTSSKIIIAAFFPYCGFSTTSNTTTSFDFSFHLNRGATEINKTYAGGYQIYPSGTLVKELYTSVALYHVDSPSTTSSTTYKIRISSGQSTSTANSNFGPNNQSLVLMEI